MLEFYVSAGTRVGNTMTIIAAAEAHIRAHAELLTRNDYDVERLIGALRAAVAAEPYNPEIVALGTIGRRITAKGLRMAGVRRVNYRTTRITTRADQNPDGDRLMILGTNLASYIAYGAEPLNIR